MNILHHRNIHKELITKICKCFDYFRFKKIFYFIFQVFRLETEDVEVRHKIPLARLKNSSQISFLPNSMFSSDWEFNEFDSRRRLLADETEGYPYPETPTPPIRNSWKNRWKQDETIQVTCPGMKYENEIISYLKYSIRSYQNGFIF